MIILRSIVVCLFMLPSIGACTEAQKLSEIKDFLVSLFEDNTKYMSKISKEEFKSFSDVQSPRATVLLCSDSRVQTDAFHGSPVNDLFTVRNIGNQIKTTEGSVEYGVDQLHTPILLIIGHSHCGAIKTALGNYSHLPKSLRVELDHMHLSPQIPTNVGVIENVNNQVAFALEKFKNKIKSKDLIVLGAVYDFRNDFHQGHARLILININGEKDPAKIKENEYLSGMKDVAIGIH